MAKKSRRVAAAAAVSRATTQAAPQGAHGQARRASRRPDIIQQRKEARREQYEKQRRQWLITRIAIGVVLVAVLGGLAFAGFRQFREWQVTRDVESYFGADDFVGQHLNTEPILYEQIPPVGGVHRDAWQNCGYYPKFINNENGVHSLEHGAVWITYDPSLPEDQVDILRSRADQQFVLVSPYPGMDAPVIASVWGKQIKLDGADDSRLDAFIRQYRKNPDNSPEPLGICWRGISATTDVEPQQEPYARADPTGPPVGGLPVSAVTATAQAQLPASPPSAPVASPVATPIAPADATPEASASPTTRRHRSQG